MKSILTMPRVSDRITRRTFVTGAAAGGALVGLGIKPGWATSASSGLEMLRGNSFDLGIGYREVNFTGQLRQATVINGGLPGPVLRWKQGENVRLRVSNSLAVDTSIHWHGIILPAGMDGVPGLSFPGIKPGEIFEYSFPVLQSGTYWYHSHSGFQEQTGLYGALIIDPIEPEPFSYDRDYVVMLSDWSDTPPDKIFTTLKKQSHYYNQHLRTFRDTLDDVQEKGIAGTWRDRAMWNRMRMSDRDIADVTGSTYTYLVNGCTPDTNWQGIFSKGERVRLRIINASAMSIFDVRIPGLKLTVVAADGQYVEPVSVDEFRIGTAEIYDVIVEPQEGAYTLFAQSIDRSGYARGTLTEQAGITAAVPAMDSPPVLTHADMGMGHNMDSEEGHAGHNMSSLGKAMGDSVHDEHNMSATLARAGLGSHAAVVHAESENGFQVDMQVEQPRIQLANPGIGLQNNGRHVLTYAELRNLNPTPDSREPGREIQLHLTGNMQRYMWSINGIRFADAEPLKLGLGERVRITLVNDTMMNHPIHLHGMWSDLETGSPDHIPRKHTVLVQPGSQISYLVTADMPGKWAYHCHLLYHMLGMFRQVEVS
ncbi:MAG: copper resistance system multicopper oxidase [Gammaproteobacteria bacterium]|nr:copper resistance system multicopper oxidase [Gammaproteobacteria bacterium]MCP4089262.1 copper resistance system multicopper oxidase [Gammaproteobacteria bacterium]MCP4275314.1 copper resistance system multicopper oxidase [Gammaproteobacteria bacterium]MCP4830902.1 copper resistance system multicopper oxidase [Gammaproteobacteria bacterium]MCP4929523.1 copper resistance system multicopper oxidase [Gammaproteobacteria bacterium]